MQQNNYEKKKNPIKNNKIKTDCEKQRGTIS